MTLVERIERGLATSDDARVVQRLIAALARMMSVAPEHVRRMPAYHLCALDLAGALADSMDACNEA